MLQERNRLLRKLRQKDSHQIELEKREQGFSLYLNGANNFRQIRISKIEEDETRLASKTAGKICELASSIRRSHN